MTDDFDSPTGNADASTQPQAESDSSALTDVQTTAAEPSQSDKSNERVNGLMAVAGRKEQEKQAALAERDAAIAARDDAASALAALQAEYDTYLQGYVAEAPAQQPAEPEPEPVFVPPALAQNHGMAPASPIAQPRPRMSEAEAALRGMEEAYADHMRGIN